MRLTILLAMVIAFAFQTACSTSSTSAPSGNDASTNDGGGESDAALPGCNLPPGYQVGLFYTYASLPSGACDDAGSCVSGGVDPCCHPTGDDLINGYTCTCSEGTWQCTVSEQGGGHCDAPGYAYDPSCIADAGSD